MKFDEIFKVKTAPYLDPKGKEMIQKLVGIPLPENFDWSAVNEEGRISRRLSKLVKQVRNVNLSSDTIATIGNIHNNYSVNDAEYTVDLTKNFNWTPGSFGDGGSCYWGSKKNAKDMIQYAGGFALRLYTNAAHDKPRGAGRAWIVPRGDFYCMFNAYGLLLPVYGGIFADIVGMKNTQTIELVNQGAWDGTLHINKGNGLIVSHEPMNIKKYDLSIDPKSWRYQQMVAEGKMYIAFCEQCGERTFHTTEDHECIGLPA